MSTDLLSLIMDFVVLTALIGTIYFALHLSGSLNNFRSYRNEMKNLIAELSNNINDAQTAIEGLKATSDIAADNLDDVLHESKRMAEELKMINETSDSLANRLEHAASGARGPMQDLQSDDAIEEEEHYFAEPDPANTDEPIEPPSFFIQDRDYDDENDQQGDELISKAERELLQALKTNKKTGGGHA